jgi:hypothetical protein
MRQKSRKYPHRRLLRSSPKNRRREQVRSSNKGVTTCGSITSTDTERSPEVHTTRYWLRNNTYIDLLVPYEKIGVPFDSASLVSSLTGNEKEKIVQELVKCEPAIRDGNLHLLEFTLEICRRCQVPAPVWLLQHAIEAINILLKLSRRTRQQMIQREIHQMRWASVHHLRASQRLNLEEAYAAATEALRDTRGRGSEETVRASYKWMNRHPFIESMRKHGLPAEIDAFAREQYENRHVTSRRLVSLGA